MCRMLDEKSSRAMLNESISLIGTLKACSYISSKWNSRKRLVTCEYAKKH